MKDNALVKMVNISKRFAGVRALVGVDCELNHNEIIGLVGDNGAGKSTLIKILSGVYPPDEGEIFIEGRKVHITNPNDAKSLGIETVYQELGLVDTCFVGKNIFLGREPIRRGIGKLLRVYDEQKMEKESIRILKTIGVDADIRFVRKLPSELSGGERQSVAIAKCMVSRPRILIFDEPTAAISVKERAKVLGFMSALREKNISGVFISHNLQEVFSVVDRVLVLGRGVLVRNEKIENITIDEVVRLMVGQ